MGMRAKYTIRRELVPLGTLGEGELVLHEDEFVDFFPFNDQTVLAVVYRVDQV